MFQSDAGDCPLSVAMEAVLCDWGSSCKKTWLGKVQAEEDAYPRATPCSGAGGHTRLQV